MKNIKSIKKIILIILTVILLVILLFMYFKSTEIYSFELFTGKEESPGEELLFGKDKVIEKTENKDDRSNNDKSNTEGRLKLQKAEIKNIALISDIKDPFKINKNEKVKNIKNKNKQDKNPVLNKDLLFLESKIISENMTEIKNPKNKKPENINLNRPKEKNLNFKQQKNKENEITAAEKEKLKKMKLSFKLIGIIKNKNKASALFLSQGQNILKKEKDKIGLFKIEQIKNKEVLLSYKNQKQRLQLWKEKKNEN